MKTHSRLFRRCLAAVVLLAAGMLVQCSRNEKSPDVTDNIRRSLDQAALKDVTVRQDRAKGVVTLGGKVTNDADKAQAESIARSNAAGQIVADQIAVIPPNNASNAKLMNADLDQAIEKNLDAELIRHRLKKGVKYDVKNGVVKLTGEVNSQAKRDEAEKIAAGVPNVQQVVNELEVRHQKATASS